MPEIRFSITSKLNKIVVDISNSMGVDKSDYIKSLILTDIREKNTKKK
jgi:hypothetical protein|tara:strand:- start:471 stop:614 length:144 start_codon:yes stop_codon:yes gene_type:complete